MKEGETSILCSNQIKEVVSVIKVGGGVIIYEEVICKVLWTLLPIYAIRVYSMQEFRAMPGDVLTIDALASRLTTFDLSKFDNSVPKIHNAFKHHKLLGVQQKISVERKIVIQIQMTKRWMNLKHYWLGGCQKVNKISKLN